ENMNQLETWHEAGVILMHMSNVAQSEARAGRDGARSKKAISYIFALTKITTDGERHDLRAIERGLFPRRARNQNEGNDVEIVFNAKKYGAVLVTADGGSRRQPGGILGRRAELARLGIVVMTDAEAVAHVREKIEERDSRMRLRAQLDGTPIPAWVGQD